MVLEYFGEDIPSVESCCTNLGGVSCDNCEKKGKGDVQLVSRMQEFQIISDALSDLPNHGINKV